MAAEELPKGWVCRLVKTTGRFPAESIEPRIDDFWPSSEDKERAKAAGIDPLVSVWDEALTTLGQAKAIYGRPSVGFGLDVERLRKLQPPGLGSPLRVVREPLPEPDDELPGADGHCGIWGLERQPEVPRNDYRRFLLNLCDMAVARG